MKLKMRLPRTVDAYKSQSQIARVITERWGQTNLFCAACDENRLIPARNNTRAFDFECAECSARYQLKSSRTPQRKRIVDSAYATMRAAIESDQAPNLLSLHYSIDWHVTNLLLIPSFCFTVSALEKRRPLAPTARRAGWVGCNILLAAIPADGKIPIVSESKLASKKSVRDRFNEIKSLTAIDPKVRGWTLDVLSRARSLERKIFTLSDIYMFEAELGALHPSNRNVRPKIRQQLQVLRDMGIVRFVSRGTYEFRR